MNSTVAPSSSRWWCSKASGSQCRAPAVAIVAHDSTELSSPESSRTTARNPALHPLGRTVPLCRDKARVCARLPPRAGSECDGAHGCDARATSRRTNNLTRAGDGVRKRKSRDGKSTAKLLSPRTNGDSPLVRVGRAAARPGDSDSGCSLDRRRRQRFRLQIVEHQGRPP
jgi:hypothetical protein